MDVFVTGVMVNEQAGEAGKSTIDGRINLFFIEAPWNGLILSLKQKLPSFSRKLNEITCSWRLYVIRELQPAYSRPLTLALHLEQCGCGADIVPALAGEAIVLRVLHQQYLRGISSGS